MATCSQCMTFSEQLNSKADEIKTLQEHVLQLVHEMQNESRKKEELQERLNDKLISLNDYAIKIRSLEEQLQSANDRYPIGELSRAEVDSVIGRGLERIHSQLVEKDMKIMDLNDIILEKERHIIELQEMFREQKELVQAKAKAFNIIQQKLLDLSTRTTREDSTETEGAYVFESTITPLSSLHKLQKGRQHQLDSFSPGHAVVNFKMGSSGSPPPADPNEECSSITLDNSNIQDDLDAEDGSSGSFLYKKKHRKKVTFDLPPRRGFRNESGQEDICEITQAFIDVTTENDQLRQTIQEMEKCGSDSQNHISQLQTQLDEMRRNGRIQVLKARASVQGKIRDLEDKISLMNTEHADKVDHLNASIETLRADREWILEENSRLLKLLDSYKQKINDSWEALDARQEEIKKLRSKLDNDRALIVQLADDLEEAQQTSNILLEQKISVLDDVERLKEALEAQDEYIELLEKDTIIYEEHVGLLRDSLGTSKAERKALIKSKAYEAKLKALEQEKELMNRKSNDEKLHIKALRRKISSLEGEKNVLEARNNELESQLIHLSKNVSSAPLTASTAAIASDVTETISNLTTSGSAFKPVNQTMMQMRRSVQRQAAMEALQFLTLGNVSTADEYQCDENFGSNMRSELNTAHEKCCLIQEKVTQLSCINFELEHQLKDAKEKLEEAKIRAQQAEEQVEEARRNCEQQKEHQKSLQSEFSVKLSVIKKEMDVLMEELTSKTEQLNARTIEVSKRNEEIKQLRFAMDEMEAVHVEIKMLQKQLNDEKIAMDSRWAEVRTVLLERNGNILQKTSHADSIAGKEQSIANQQMINTINDLNNTVNKQAKQLELDKVEKRKYKAVIRQMQADEKAPVAPSVMNNEADEQYEAQIVGLQKQRDFMDREMTLLCSLNNSKDVLIHSLKTKLEIICSQKSELLDLKSESDKNEDKINRTKQLQVQLDVVSQEKSELSNSVAKSNAELQEMRMRTQQLQMECDRLRLQLQFSPKQNLVTMPSAIGTHQHVQLQQAQQQMEFINCEMDALPMSAISSDSTANKNINTELKAQTEKLTSALQEKNKELRKILNENEALKIKCVESTAALDLLSNEFERRSQEKDNIIEMLQSQHTYLTQTILLNEENAKRLTTSPTISQGIKTNNEPKYLMLDASTTMEEAGSDPIRATRNWETQTETDFHFSETSEIRQELTSELLRKTVHDYNTLESENQEICENVNTSNEMHNNFTDEVKHLMVLNAELETAVEVLKGEIWSLNEKLKESLDDREDLSDKLCELSQRHEEEIERARERERELEEQKDMAEKCQRQAALAENESNRRLVEWQEKSVEMENNRIELENAYAKLSEYYQQLQQAYNILYARCNTCKVDNSAQTTVDSDTFKTSEEFAEKIEYVKCELAQREKELQKKVMELQHVRNLLQEYLNVTLRNVKDLRGMNLKLLKDVVGDSEQVMQAQVHKALKEVCSYAEEVINKWFKEKELKDAEIASGIQQLMNNIPPDNISETDGQMLAMIVESANKKLLEKETENAGLENDLWNEKSDKSVLRMKLRQFRSIADQSSSAARKRGTVGIVPWNCSIPCTICRELEQTKQPVSTPQLQLAILAARLTTKIADNDALFRCNAELVQTNLRLQNEIDQLKQQMDISTNNTHTLVTNQQLIQQQQDISEQSSIQSSEQKLSHKEGKEWTWGAENSDIKLDISQQPILNQQINGSTITNEIQLANTRELKTQEDNIESWEKKLNGAQAYCKEFDVRNELEFTAQKLEDYPEISEECCSKDEDKVEQLEDGLKTRQHEDAKEQAKLEESKTICEELLVALVESPKQNLQRQNGELQSTKCKVFQADFGEEQNEIAERKLKEDDHEKEENDWFADGTLEDFRTLLEEKVQDIPQNTAAEDGKIQMIQKLERQIQQKEVELQKLEETNKHVDQQLKLQQQLIEELESDLYMIKERNVILEEENISMKQEITNQKKNYEELIIEKEKLMEKVDNDVRMNMYEEIVLLKEKNESLVLELNKKQVSLDEEKTKLASRGIVLDELKRKLKHSEEKNIQMQRELNDCNMQISELQQRNEIDQEFRQQLVKAQKKVTELEEKLNQLIEQNELLKNGEQKLLDSLMISNEQLAETESKNETLKLEISKLQTSLLKTEGIVKKIVHPEKPAMNDVDVMVVLHDEPKTSSTMMQLYNASKEKSTQESKFNILKEPFESTFQTTTYNFREANADKLRRRKNRTGGFEGAEKL